MYIMDQVEDFASKHIEDIIKKENVTPDCIEMLGELVDIVKDASEYRKNNSTTYAMDTYSPSMNSYPPSQNMGMNRQYVNGTPNSYGGNMNYGYQGNMSYNNMYGNKENLLQKMQYMLSEAKTEQEKMAIQECINKLS